MLDASARWRVSEHIQLFAAVDNLLDEKYETFGTFSPTADVPIVEAPGASDPRSLSPAAPLSVYAGVSLSF